jgi:lipoprotein NlpI
VIQHCTAAIGSGKYTGTALAALYKSRGAEWANKGESDRAIADFDQTLKLQPGTAVVYHARAVELAGRGDYARAIADYDQTLKLDPTATADFGKGRALYYMGNYRAAAATLEAELQARPNLYVALWLYLARQRGGVADADEQLERETRRLRAGWPAPVVAYYMGRTDEQSVINGSRAADEPRRRAEMRCEADFYLAEGLLLKNDKARALPLLQHFQSQCPKSLLEYEGTRAELRRSR